MFFASDRHTMANARPKFRNPEPEVPQRISIIEASRRWKERQAELKRLRVIEEMKVAPPPPLRTFDDRPARMSARDIIAVVAVVHGVHASDITGHSRHKQIVAARFDAIRAVADAWPELTQTAMGRIFKRDHTSILNALKKTRRPGQVR